MNGYMDDREARVRRNEVVSRALNDQNEYLDETFAIDGKEFAIVCECGQINCSRQIRIARSAYARVRSDPKLFLLIPGHEDKTLEEVVDSEKARYAIVRKLPAQQPR